MLPNFLVLSISSLIVFNVVLDKPTCSVASFGQYKSAIVDLYKGTIDQRLSQELNMLVRSYAKIVAKKKRAGVMSCKEGILFFFCSFVNNL